MLTLDLPAEPYWIDLPRGVRVEIRPVTTAVMAAAQAAAARRLAAIRIADPDLDPDMARGLSFAFLVKALARGGRAADGPRRHRRRLLGPGHRTRRRGGRRGKRLRARAAWHFGRGPDYCRGCAALGRDCADACLYAAQAPTSLEGHACWAAGTACAEVTMAGLTLDTASALAAARELGAAGWAAAELLLAIRIGMAEGATARRDGEGKPHG
jgi:hypothetical protein